MLGTELLKGQGLGNQLFCYITTRCLALRGGYEFSILGREILGNDVYSRKGMYFMDLDLGRVSAKEDYVTICQEKEDRLFLPNSAHDMTHGAYITGTDEALMALPDNTLVGGNMQAQDYFRPYKQEIKEWLRVKPEFDSYEYSRDNLCILNLRGGEYTSDPALYLRRKYWVRAMAQMRRIRADMEFLIVTDDVEAAKKLLPELPAVHGSLHEDYTHIKNAKYLILSNSSFAFFRPIPARHCTWRSHRNIGQDTMFPTAIGQASKIYMMSLPIWIAEAGCFLRKNAAGSWSSINKSLPSTKSGTRDRQESGGCGICCA